MPSFEIACDGVAASASTDLRGSAVLVVAGGPPAAPVPNAVTLDLRPGDAPPPGACVATDPAARGAFAVIAGVAPEDLTGTEFLADPNLWLRAVHSPNTAGGWHTTAELVAAIQQICTSPIEQPAGGTHEHQH